MHWLRWVVIGLSVILGGWMVYDGGRALVVGDYTTPAAGPYQGQLGPWARLVEGVGIEPRGTAMKTVFVVLGLLWLGAVVAWVLGADWAAWTLLALALLSLWYAPVGTVLAVVVAALVLWLRGAG